jgi:hypothetical protein
MYMTIFDELHWAFISTMTGAYLAAIRAFRFVFEYAVQSWVLEEKYKNLPEDDEKINTVLEDYDARQFKSYMIDQLKFLDETEVKSARDLYHRLSEFVHPQSRILTTFNLDSLATFDMNPNLLRLCADFAVEVADILEAILVQRYPTLKHEPELVAIAKELSLKITSSRLRQ